MRYSISASDAATLQAALLAIRQNQYANGAPIQWDLTLAANGLSATLDTSATSALPALPTGAKAQALPPDSIALWQAKAVLQQQGLLDKANATVAAANNAVLNAFWANAASIDRTSPTLAQIGTALGLTSAQLDAMFIAGAAIAL